MTDLPVRAFAWRRALAVPLAVLVVALASPPGVPVSVPSVAAAPSGGCTIISPATNCMYSCIAGETQHVRVVFGNDVRALADCGFGVAACYTGTLGVSCSDSGSSATFSDTYWNACSITHSGPVKVWVVECTSGS